MKIALTPQEVHLAGNGDHFSDVGADRRRCVHGRRSAARFNYLYGWDINEDWTLGGSTGINADIDDVTNDSYSRVQPIVDAWSLVDGRVSSYTEWFVLAPIGADTNRPQNYFNGGFTVLFNNDLQWDIRAGVGLNEAADDFFAGRVFRCGIGSGASTYLSEPRASGLAKR